MEPLDRRLLLGAVGIAGPGSIIGMYRNNAIINFSTPYTMAGTWINGGGNV